jgi:hypothetical protein
MFLTGAGALQQYVRFLCKCLQFQFAIAPQNPKTPELPVYETNKKMIKTHVPLQ